MIGIYKYTNQINGKVYIGQSIDIRQRQYAHKSSAYNEKANDFNTQFHQAIRKYGIENFDFEILEEIAPEEYNKVYLDQLEKYYIKKYDSFHTGYNASEGGDLLSPNAIGKGEKNGRALLKTADVEYIRECYNAHIPFRTVYKEYQDKISKRGLQKIWWFDTWKDIHPEYHNEENKYFHSHMAKANNSEVAKQNKRCFSVEQVKEMRRRYEDGETPKEIWKSIAPERAWSTVYNVLIKQTYKDIE